MFVLDTAILGAAGLAALICGLEHGGWKWGEAVLCFLAMATPMLLPDYITSREGAVVMVALALRPVLFGQCTKLMGWCRAATGLAMGGLMWCGAPAKAMEAGMAMPMTMPMPHTQGMNLSASGMGLVMLIVVLTGSAYVMAFGWGAVRLSGRPVPRLGMVAIELSAMVAALIGMAQMSGVVMV